MAKKLRVYLDTSVPNAYFDSARPERQAATQDFWKALEQYDVFISRLVLEEIEKTPNLQIRKELQALVKSFDILPMEGEEIERLALEYVANEIIPYAYIEDALHIVAAATFHDMDILVSWNYRHMVKLKTKREVNAINLVCGYKTIEIIDPLTL